jgi:cytochrome P450
VTAIANYPSLAHAECPYPLYEELRRDMPVVCLQDSGDYLVTRHEDVHFALSRPDLFSSDVGAAAPREHAGGYRSMLNTDPPEHAPKRKLAFDPFKPARLRAIDPDVRAIADAVIDAFIDDGEADLMDAFALPIPIKVTSRLMGLPEADYDQIKDWSSIEGSGQAYLDAPERAVDRAKDLRMVDYVKAAVAHRRAQPGGDVLSEMITAQVARDGEFDELILEAEGATLLLGGIVTTAHLICSALHLLLRSPGTLAAVRADHAQIPRLLEEVLRIESPVQWRPRRCVADTELGGVTIPAGARVLLVLGAANRDGACFAQPQTLDHERANVKRHVAFGYGAHFCLGAPLARLEGKHALERLLARVDDLALAVGDHEVQHIRSVLFRAPAALPVTFRKR